MTNQLAINSFLNSDYNGLDQESSLEISRPRKKELEYLRKSSRRIKDLHPLLLTCHRHPTSQETINDTLIANDRESLDGI